MRWPLLLIVCSITARAVEPDQPPSVVARTELRIATSPPGAAITLDGALVGISPRVESLSPGVHTLTAELSGAVTTQTISLVAGEVRSVTLSLVPLDAPPRTFPVVGALTFAGGAVALGAGLLLRIPAHETGLVVSGLYRAGGRWDQQAFELEAAGLRAQTWSWFFTGAGVAVMASGLIVAGLELFGHRSPLPALVFVPTRGGGVLGWGTSW